MAEKLAGRATNQALDKSRAAPEELARLLDQVARMARGLQYSDGLNPAQWDSLRFISRANRLSRTPGALAAVLGTTKGTASQTLNALEAKGYLTRVRDEADKRVRHLEITDAGRALLARDPLCCLEQALGRLPAAQAAALQEGLSQVCGDLRAHCESPEFGTCARCGHLEGTMGEGDTQCGLKGVTLVAEDLAKLCVNFQDRKRACGSD